MQFNSDHETILEHAPFRATVINETEYQAAYLDYLNNFLTVDRFASYYGWSTEHANQVIVEGKQIHNNLTSS